MATLNPQQQLAASHLEGPMLIIAGAGSGKTRVITHRIAHLLKLGIPSSEILALTFTNKAANEMRARIEALAHQSVSTLTFHSLGARILRQSIAALGYTSDFTIYDAADSLNLFKQCFALKGHKQEKGKVKKCKAAISAAKNALCAPEDFLSDLSSEFDLLCRDIYTLYQAKLKEYNAVDFDDLLYLPYTLFSSFPDILAFYQKTWSFICIDEYQDTNKAQYLLAKLLVKTHQNLFVVGDPDQSIYSWRGANFRTILDFEKDYPGAKIISLEQNYRSTTRILEAANALIEHNATRYEKKLWSALGPGEKIKVYLAQNEKEEAHFVATELAEVMRTRSSPLSDCAIFYRTNAQSRALEDALLKFHIPYAIVGNISFYERREVKDILSLLRLLASGADFLSFSRSIALLKNGIGPVTLRKWQTAAEQAALPILPFCRSLVAASGPFKLSSKQRQGLERYLTIIDHLKREVSQGASIKTLIVDAIERLDYLTYLKDDPETYEDRRENLDALVAKGAEWQDENPSGSLTAFLEELSLTGKGEDSLHSSAVQLMTLHNGKGLEFHTVFVVGLEEGLLPHTNSQDSQEALEEERRLLYVGMTRAKQLLYLTGATFRLLWGTVKMMCPSPFLREIPDHYCAKLSQSNLAPKEASPPNDGDLVLGSTVFHRDFGQGTIQKIYQTSLGTTYDVHFSTLNITRSLVGKYAKLKKAP